MIAWGWVSSATKELAQELTRVDSPSSLLVFPHSSAVAQQFHHNDQSQRCNQCARLCTMDFACSRETRLRWCRKNISLRKAMLALASQPCHTSMPSSKRHYLEGRRPTYLRLAWTHKDALSRPPRLRHRYPLLSSIEVVPQVRLGHVVLPSLPIKRGLHLLYACSEGTHLLCAHRPQHLEDSVPCPTEDCAVPWQT